MDRAADQTRLTEASSTEPEDPLDEDADPASSDTAEVEPPDVDRFVPAGAADSVPAGTAPEVPPALGTSETMAPVQGVHTPDVGEGGRDFDTAATPLPGRTDHGRT